MSIVVPTYNRRASLERLLHALAEQTFPGERFEVIVVDDGSSDSTLAFLHELRQSYTLRVFEQPHQGPAAARNLGVANAHAPLILFLDDDVVPLPNLIERHLATHASEGPDCVVIGPMSPPGDWPRSAWVRWEEEKLLHQYAMLQNGEWSCTPRQFYTGNSSVGRALITAAGGFDAEYKRAEDVELGYRMRDLGARFVFEPGADVLHYASRTFSAWCNTPYSYGRYDVIMSRTKGHEALGLALSEFRGRHVLNRALSRLTIGKPRLLAMTLGALQLVVRASSRVGGRRTASRALSGIFHLLYWQGACDALGGPRVLWQSIDRGMPATP